jgi:uroporphyrinogen-III synthase
MRALAGLGVLVTRPEQQAGPLAHRLLDLGATVYRLPALEIRAPSQLEERLAAAKPISRYDWVIFTSANAVRFGSRLLDDQHSPALVAIGPATATALTGAGHPLAFVPPDGYDSEHVLAMPELQSLSQQRVLLVRGGRGRDLLAMTLRERGAVVDIAEVYERVTATPVPGTVDALEAAWAAGHIHVVTVTSVEIGRGLYELLSPAGRGYYARTPLLVGSSRIAESLRVMELQGPLIVAARPDDAGLLAALLATPRDVLQPKSSA